MDDELGHGEVDYPGQPHQQRILSARQALRRYPNILKVATVARHDDGSVVNRGCDDQFEFLLLDGFERLHRQGWSSQQDRRGRG